MKTRFFTILLSFFIINFAMSQQVAVNFNVDDCNRNNYDLFDLLDEGKVVVLCWIMPCGTCVLPTKTAYNVFSSCVASNPDKLMFFLCDDYGISPCATIKNFASTNRLEDAIPVSDPSIAMSDYGDVGMPKIVVIGGSDHIVFDVQDISTNQDAVNAQQLLNAINSAISHSSTANNANLEDDNLVVFPNPATTDLYIEYPNAECLNSQIFDISGKIIKNLELRFSKFPAKIDIADLKSGVYFLKINNRTTNFIKK